MAKLKPVKLSVREGAPVPLFSRLIDDHPHVPSEEVVKNLLTPEELESSIAGELEIILNTRIAAFEEDDQRPSIPDYYRLPEFFGLRDFSFYNIETEIGKAYIARKIREAILRFEPRLLSPQVILLGLGEDKVSLMTEIKGEIRIGTYRRQVTFPIRIYNLLQKK